MTEPIFRLANPSDHESIVNLMNSAYRGESSRTGWTTEADFFAGERINVAALRSQLGDGGKRVMLVMHIGAKSDLCGCVFVELETDPDGRGSYLGMLTIDPLAQARGLGRRLLDAAEDYARKRGSSRMMLTVLNPRDQLMAWYERRGYRRTGETKPFPYASAEREKPLRSDLHFIFFAKDFV